jgi:hypothetical protein
MIKFFRFFAADRGIDLVDHDNRIVYDDSGQCNETNRKWHTIGVSCEE